MLLLQLEAQRAKEEQERLDTQRPLLCRKSLKIAAHLAQFGPRRTSTRAVSHPQAPMFEPEINPVSASRTSRSLHDLSVGEQERRQAKREAAIRKKSEDEMQGLTFRPTVTQRAETVPRVSIAKDPEAYMRRMREKQAEKERKLEEARRKKEAAALEACTFQPTKKTSCPSYHKRLLHSAQAHRTAARQPARLAPEWR